MRNLLSALKTHLPVISTVAGVIYAALVQANVFNANNKIVILVVGVLASLGIVINHVRIQKITKSTSTVTPIVK